MPSFDIVSEVDKHELTNAVDTANRELGNRFDFKGQDASFELDGFVVMQRAPARLTSGSAARGRRSPSARASSRSWPSRSSRR